MLRALRREGRAQSLTRVRCRVIPRRPIRARTCGPQVFYGGCAPFLGSLVSTPARALAMSTFGCFGVAALLPLFAMCAALWQYCAVAVCFGVAGAAQLTPTSMLLEHAVAEGPLRTAPGLLYALFNCSFVLGMAVGPGACAGLTDLLGYPRAAAVIAGTVASLVAAVALLLAREFGLLQLRRHEPERGLQHSKPLLSDGSSCCASTGRGEPARSCGGSRVAAAAGRGTASRVASSSTGDGQCPQRQQHSFRCDAPSAAPSDAGAIMTITASIVRRTADAGTDDAGVGEAAAATAEPARLIVPPPAAARC